ncbi:thiamine-phosphate kinase [Tsuneonella sp. HG222]
MKGEAAFIAALRQIARDPAARGLDDDCAVLPLGAEMLVLTHDAMVEGVHSLPGQDLADVAWKLVASNLSDLAAKGARPIGVLLGHTLGEGDDRFLAGLEEVLGHYGVPLLGGDTVSGTGARTWGLTAIGTATHVPVPSRSGARPSDEVWITGALGGAMIGFEAMRGGLAADTMRYRRPMARLIEGELLAPLVTAMMDISDGLLLDASRMAQASGVTIEIDGSAVPVQAPEERREDAMRWGDDYELLFTLPRGSEAPVAASRIGRVGEGGGSPVLVDGREPQGKLGYEH